VSSAVKAAPIWLRDQSELTASEGSVRSSQLPGELPKPATFELKPVVSSRSECNTKSPMRAPIG